MYEGEFENDRKHGKGFEVFQNKSTYEGMYVNGKPEGMQSCNLLQALANLHGQMVKFTMENGTMD